MTERPTLHRLTAGWYTLAGFSIARIKPGQWRVFNRVWSETFPTLRVAELAARVKSPGATDADFAAFETAFWSR